MALYDCFMYFDEDMLLDIRLNILNETVDKFVIAEATKTHSGQDKKLNFDIKNFLKFIDCLLYTSDAADEEDSVDLCGGRIIKK